MDGVKDSWDRITYKIKSYLQENKEWKKKNDFTLQSRH